MNSQHENKQKGRSGCIWLVIVLGGITGLISFFALDIPGILERWYKQPTPVVNNKSTLSIVNNTQTITVCYLYISPVDSSGWGEDQLKGNQIKPGDSYSIDVDPATYNLKIEDCNHANAATLEGQDLNSSVEWKLNETAVPSPTAVVNSKSTLKIINNTQTITICYLYISPVDSSGWGEDQLKGNQIKPGDSYSIDVEPATYNLKVEDCNHANAATREGQDLNSSIEWTLTESVVPSTVTLTVQNDNPSVSICYLYIAPADSSDWGDDVLRGEKIAPGGSTNFTLTPGFYNLKAVDCDQSGSATAQNLNITRTTTWTLK